MSAKKHTETTRTHPAKDRLAVVFDFDDTLAPDSWDGFLNTCGFDADRFERERVDPLKQDGWDPIPAKFYALIQASREQTNPDGKITHERLQAYGRELQPFQGVPDMFDRVRQRARQAEADVDVEFYIVSSGLADIIRATPIAREFKGIWGCDFHFGEDGEVEFVKMLVSHTEKPRYLHLIEKGPEQYADKPPYAVYRKLPEEELHVPLQQMIYVGDGSSDVACFSLLNASHGIAIGVNKEGTKVNWGNEDGVSSEERIANIATADYRDGSELMRTLLLAVDSICARIAIHDLSQGE